MPHFLRASDSIGVENPPSTCIGIATQPGLKEFQTSHPGRSLVGSRGRLETNANPLWFFTNTWVTCGYVNKVASSMAGSQSSHDQMTVPLAWLKLLLKAAHSPSTHLSPLAGYPLSLSLPNSHLMFPGAPAALLCWFPAVPCGRCLLPAHPYQILEASGTNLSLPPLGREPSLRGPFGILGTESHRVIPYALCASLAPSLTRGPGGRTVSQGL